MKVVCDTSRNTFRPMTVTITVETRAEYDSLLTGLAEVQDDCCDSAIYDPLFVDILGTLQAALEDG